MSEINKKVISVSANALYNKAKVTGYLNLEKINELYLYDYYMSFTKLYSMYNNEHQLLRNAIYKLRTRLDNICDYKSILPNLTVVPNVEPVNIAPVLLNEPTVNLNIYEDYNLELNKITENGNFVDANGDSLDSIYIYVTEITTGTLSISGAKAILVDDIYIKASDFSKLVYTQTPGTYTVNIPFRVQDNNINPLFSPKYNYIINVDTVAVENQPATIGDITLYPDNRAITTITLDMLTNQLNPPYNDPEGDLLDAIRIDEISTANQGQFYYDGVVIIEGLIILRQDIIDEKLEHRSANVDDVTSDVFNFSVRDAGSGQWSTNI